MMILGDYKMRMTRNEPKIDAFIRDYAENRILYHHNKKNGKLAEDR